ncbi:unnamed protein product [Arctogadus glacialis]
MPFSPLETRMVLPVAQGCPFSPHRRGPGSLVPHPPCGTHGWFLPVFVSVSPVTSTCYLDFVLSIIEHLTIYANIQSPASVRSQHTIGSRSGQQLNLEDLEAQEEAEEGPLGEISGLTAACNNHWRHGDQKGSNTV